MTTKNKKHVLVLMGGWSAERDVSLASGAACASAIKEAGYQVTTYDLNENLNAFLDMIQTTKPDVVFNALHGRYGEDGNIQAVLNILKIPYTHSGLLASATAMDKPATLQLFKTGGLPIAQGQVILEQDLSTQPLKDLIEISFPLVIKPAREGSSVGVYIVNDETQLPDLANWTFGDILVEEYVDGMELTVAVMEDKALAVTELRPHDGFYSYEHKYTDGKTTHICPADIPTVLDEKLKEYAIKAHQILGCRGVSRTDYRYNPQTEQLIILEINTQPGMTALSLVPEQAAAAGISFPELVSWMIEEATCDQ